MTLYADDAARFDRALQALEGAYEIGDRDGAELLPLVIDRLTA